MHSNSLIASSIILLALNLVSPARASEPTAQTVPTTASTVEQTKTRGFAVWVQPVGTVLSGALGGGVYLPLGMNISLSPRTSLVLELTGISGNLYACKSTSSGIWAAAGVAFSTGKDASHNGFFVEPKLAVRHLETSGAHSEFWFCPAGSDKQLNQSDTSLSLGLDVGYQMVWGPIFFAPIVGASTGVCLNCTELGLVWKDTTRRDRLALDLNLNLLRVGFAF